MAHNDTGWYEAARAVLDTLGTVRDLGINGTLVWLTKLGAHVNARPSNMSLNDLRTALTQHNGGVAPDGSSIGNLSKAATAYRALVLNDLDPTALARYRQRDLYAAACAVEAGTLAVEDVLDALANGTLSEVKPTTPRTQPTRTDPLPEPEPSAPQPDPLMVAVFEAAMLGAGAAGMDVLAWVQQQAALALIS